MHQNRAEIVAGKVEFGEDLLHGIRQADEHSSRGTACHGRDQKDLGARCLRFALAPHKRT